MNSRRYFEISEYAFFKIFEKGDNHRNWPTYFEICKYASLNT